MLKAENIPTGISNEESKLFAKLVCSQRRKAIEDANINSAARRLFNMGRMTHHFVTE